MIADDFTQIVWNKTKKIGMGYILTPDDLIVVALYEPGGNIQGQFISNIFEPIKMNQGESSGNKED